MSYEKWLTTRLATINELEQLAKKLDHLAYNTTFANFVGSGLGLVGGAGLVLSALAAPFTGGLSLEAAIGFLGVGAVVSVGSAVVKEVEESGLIGKVKTALDRDEKATNEMKNDLEILQNYVQRGKDIAMITECLSKLGLRLCDQLKSGAIPVSVEFLQSTAVASNVISEVGSFARNAIPILNVVSLSLDIVQVIKRAIDTANGSVSEAAKDVRKKTEQLQKELKAIKIIMAPFASTS